MKIIRYATLYLGIDTDEPTKNKMELDGVDIHVELAGKSSGRTRFLIQGLLDLEGLPELDAAKEVVIPDKPRRQIESAIEITSNLIAIGRHCGRSLSSPMPFIALVPQSESERDWLALASWFRGGLICLPATSLELLNCLGFLDEMQDRFDGVALLAEALAHGHSTGRFHEFIRFFESAFSLSPSQLSDKLPRFLSGADLGYTRDEINRWIDLRNSATHADLRRTRRIVYEADVRLVIPRMEQAAYDVLFNKKDWHSPSRVRRTIWKPTVSTYSENHNLQVVKGEDANFAMQLLDPFGAFSYDASFNLLPILSGVWSKWSEEGASTAFRGKLRVLEKQ